MLATSNFAVPLGITINLSVPLNTRRKHEATKMQQSTRNTNETRRMNMMKTNKTNLHLLISQHPAIRRYVPTWFLRTISIVSVNGIRFRREEQSVHSSRQTGRCILLFPPQWLSICRQLVGTYAFATLIKDDKLVPPLYFLSQAANLAF